MNNRLLLILFSLGVLVAALAALGQEVPGYMDADYYYASAIRLAAGQGFSEPFLWNYLDDPAGIPHPSHLYWMPLTSILAAGAMKLLGSTSFWTARMPFLVLAGLLPILSIKISEKVWNNRKTSWLAGILGIFSGVYVVYASIPETFLIYMVLGGVICLLVVSEDWAQISSKKIYIYTGFLGLLAGGMHLARADGILWMLGGLIWISWTVIHSRKPRNLRVATISLVLFIISYFVIMGAWYLRNIDLFRTLMAAGNSRSLWITAYNQTFYFPADSLTFGNWWKAGLAVHISAWWNALIMNLKNLVGVQGMVILLPLAFSGFWQRRSIRGIKFFYGMWILVFGLMTFIFPYAGARGGHLHSASAFQTLIWAAVPAGLERFVDWGKRKRNWQPSRAIPAFAVILLTVCLILTGFFYLQKVFGTGNPSGRWGASFNTYEEVGRELNRFETVPKGLIMVNNPPGFWLATGRSAIVIPGGDLQQTLDAAARYNAKLLLLEAGQENLEDLWLHPLNSEGFIYLGEIENVKVFNFNN